MKYSYFSRSVAGDNAASLHTRNLTNTRVEMTDPLYAASVFAVGPIVRMTGIGGGSRITLHPVG